VSSTFLQNLDINFSPTAAFNAPQISACDQLDVNFLNLSSGATQYLWDFGDNTSDSSANPVHHYSSGSYSVKLVAINPFGCKDSVTQFNYIKVEPTPTALFTSSPPANTPIERSNAYFAFLNQSGNATGYLWNFGDGEESNDINPVHAYLDTGRFTVQLIAYNSLGCSDTTDLSHFIVVPSANIFVPSAFTPNDNGINDKLKVYGTNLDEVNLQIFDRWGEKVYDGDGLNDGWDGTLHGRKLNAGVYLYLIRITKSNGKTVMLKGDITLIK
jgi:gliding motility-associated-like protein